ncbi:MAG: hypothetical protein AMS21_08240 [Gemmatimonas sp. SG8_38_2]|nr:MAG: hypothetical protein AMS21_08240 [Gemmatimonas sp. SG8_38_2]
MTQRRDLYQAVICAVPLHARKVTGLMQDPTGSDRPILLEYDTQGGHSAGTPVSRQIEDQTDTFSFLVWQLTTEKAKKGVMDD